MSKFASDWLNWGKNSDTPTQQTDKTDRRALVSNVSSSSIDIQRKTPQKNSVKALSHITDKTDRREKWVKVSEWEFSLVQVPKQARQGKVDIWMVGERLDKPGLKFWFSHSIEVQ